MAKCDLGCTFDGYWTCVDSDKKGNVTLRNEFNGRSLRMSRTLFQKVKKGERTVSSVIKNEFCRRKAFGRYIANWAERNWGNYE